MNASELDDILNQRDEAPFDRAWCELNQSISELTEPFDTQHIFVKLSKATTGHEICSYICDDLELIHKAEILGIKSKFLDYLRQSYAQGKVPHEWNS